ncbi:hypothetical protein A9Q84_05810 [Halobacteriovorax marinus]|uniref:Uncharacterized protein n=1 Tax=Halobacteriovorax marinus TaxID=97084 RepID=A0A1Y5FBE4_9BACT|nr:hypothetical protein A9Q84_05810 [Halobacteriovorax marinus]
MRILILITLLQLVGCSSSSTNKDVASPSSGSIEEFSWIENTDFNKTPEIPFNQRQDVFSGEISTTDSLSTESLARVPAPKLQVITGPKDILAAGITYCYKRDFTNGLKIFKDNYKKYKSHPGYWNLLGTCYYLQGETRKALLFYNKSRDLKKNYAPPINNIGVIYQYQGLEQKALAAFKKASEVGSFSMTPMFNLGQLYLKYNLISDAKRIFQRLVNIKSSDVDATNGLATSYLKEGNSQMAVSLYSGLPSSAIEKPNVGITFSLALFNTGRQKDAKLVLASVKNDSLRQYSSYYNSVFQKIGGVK